ncbi:MAG: hypothetical protein AAGA62_03300, partial [Bacteroidota bacterium]
EILEINILWTRARPQVQSLRFEISGDGTTDADLQVLTPSPLTIPAGATEATIQLRVAEGVDPERLEREGTIEILDGEWFELTERRLYNFVYSVPHTAAVKLWAPDLAFPVLWGYTSFGPEPVPEGSGLDAGPHFAFAYASRTEPNIIGMYNAVPGTSSTNALNMVRIYADYDVSSASAGIRIFELFKLTPASEGATFGRVEVIEQQVTITRRSSSGLPPFQIGLSGSGTYDEDTGILLVDIFFDETELGNGASVLRRYSYESKKRE